MLLLEDENTLKTILATATNRGLQFTNYKPQGFVIEDTYNNINFPIHDPQLDSAAKTYIDHIKNQADLLYDFENDLPWHFTIEFYRDEYLVYYTRQLTSIYPIKNKDTLSMYLNKESKDLIKSSKDISQMIHIVIIGDTNTDVYLKSLYATIMNRIIKPIAMQSQLSYMNKVYYLNIGNRFKKNYMRT